MCVHVCVREREEKRERERENLLGWQVLVLHGESDMVALLPELVLDGDSVISGVLCRQVSDGQGTVGPVTFPLQKWLKLRIVTIL